MILDLEEREVQGVTVVDMEGKMTTTTSSEAEAFLKELVNDGTTQIVLNMEAVDFVASTGLRVILATGKRLLGLGGTMVVCSLNPTVAEVFRISGFSQMFKVFDTEEEAVASF